MKPPRPKVHLLDVSEPLLAYHNLICRCGITLRNAQPKFMLSQDWIVKRFSTIDGICSNCAQDEPTADDKRHYVYGLCEGQEERNSAE